MAIAVTTLTRVTPNVMGLRTRIQIRAGRNRCDWEGRQLNWNRILRIVMSQGRDHEGRDDGPDHAEHAHQSQRNMTATWG